jgi:hypothetical protein
VTAYTDSQCHSPAPRLLPAAFALGELVVKLARGSLRLAICSDKSDDIASDEGRKPWVQMLGIGSAERDCSAFVLQQFPSQPQGPIGLKFANQERQMMSRR